MMPYYVTYICTMYYVMYILKCSNNCEVPSICHSGNNRSAVLLFHHVIPPFLQSAILPFCHSTNPFRNNMMLMSIVRCKDVHHPRKLPWSPEEQYCASSVSQTNYIWISLQRDGNFGNPCSVMKVPMVVDGENVMNTDDKVDSLIMLLIVFVWNLTSLTCSYYNIKGGLITNSHTLSRFWAIVMFHSMWWSCLLSLSFCAIDWVVMSALQNQNFLMFLN